MKKESKEKDKVTIKIPRPLYEKLQVIITGSGYNSVTDFVVYVLRDLAATSSRTGEKVTPAEIERIKDRLRNLGYLD